MAAISRPEDFVSRQRALEERVATLERTTRLNSASIGEGGLTVREKGGVTVKEGGGLTIEDGGDVNVVDGGNLEISDGGDVVVSDGGDFVVKQPGTFKTEFPNGQVGVYFGGLGPSPYYHGTLWFDDDGDTRAGIFLNDTGDFNVVFGTDTGDGRVMHHVVRAEGAFHVEADSVHVEGETGVVIDSPGDQTQIGLTASSVFIGHTTTGSAANTRLEDTGLFQRVVSSRRYKQDIKNANIDPMAVLKVQGRTWVDNGEALVNDDPPHHIGYIAEELHDLGLTAFVDYDEQGRPDAIQYDRMSVGLLEVVKMQQKMIETLTSRVAALEKPGSAAQHAGGKK